MNENEKPSPPRRRRRRRGTGRHYFPQEHEDAIVQYCRTPDRKERERLYRDLIQPALSEMVDKIVYTYKFYQSTKHCRITRRV